MDVSCICVYVRHELSEYGYIHSADIFTRIHVRLQIGIKLAKHLELSSHQALFAPATDSRSLLGCNTQQTHSLIYSLTHSHTHSLIHSLTHSLIHSFAYSLTHSLTHSHTHSLTYSLTHSLTHSLTIPLTRSLTHSHAH